MAQDRFERAPVAAEAGDMIVPASAPPINWHGADLDEESGGLDIRRYLSALRRFKWLLVLGALAGSGGAYYAWETIELEYTAVGNLWLEGANQDGDLAPIRQGGLLEESAWIELLKSYSVLDSVVIKERLYLQHPREFSSAFASFQLADTFAAGAFRLSIDENGSDYALFGEAGSLVERGTLGGPIAERLGYGWAPEADLLLPGSEVEFSVIPPRDASHRLRDQILTRMDQRANFITLSLVGSDPERTASIIQSLMERHVTLAAELKRAQLDEMRAILEEQLVRANDTLTGAERALEQFRVNTITLPSDDATPIAPGIELTRGPVFGSFFQMKVDLDILSRDRDRLEVFLDGLDGSDIPIETLEVIPAANSSSELRSVLTELVAARSELRTYRNRYSESYPPVQELLVRIETMEGRAIPRIVRSLHGELAAQVAQLQARVDSASAELSEIPVRAIEEARLRRRVDIQETLYNDLRSRVEVARLASASSIPDVRILDPARVPRVPSSDERMRMAGLILIGGIGASILLALLLDRVDSKLRYPDQVSHDLGLDILGGVPRIVSTNGRRGMQNTEQVVEAFRELRMRIGFAFGSAGPLTLTITSPDQGEGKSLITTNLAVAFAEMGRRTLLIDGDARRGDAHRLLGLERMPGLTDYLRDRGGEDVIQSTEYEALDFIACGTRGTATPELLASAQMASFMGTLRRAYDVILVDSPPLAAGADPLILGGLTGNLALVLRTGSTQKQLTEAKLDVISRLPMRILGAILNDVEASGVYKYYRYLSDYTAQAEGTERDGAQKKVLAQVDS